MGVALLCVSQIALIDQKDLISLYCHPLDDLLEFICTFEKGLQSFLERIFITAIVSTLSLLQRMEQSCHTEVNVNVVL